MELIDDSVVFVEKIGASIVTKTYKINQIKETISNNEIIYQWTKFNPETEQWDDDVTNETEIQGHVPVNGQVTLPYTKPQTQEDILNDLKNDNLALSEIVLDLLLQINGGI